VRPGVWKCWACRGEPHQSMPEGYVAQAFFDKVQRHNASD